MTQIDQKIKDLRVNLRHNAELIVDDVFQRHAIANSYKTDEICVFCNSKNNITDEHIIPRWVFEKCTKQYFVINVNKQKQTYNKSTIPVCSNCNNCILSYIEKYIIGILEIINDSHEYYQSEAENIIRWLEIIDYKLQIHGTRLRYIKHAKSKSYDKDLSVLSIASISHSMNFAPWRVFTHIRNAQRRIIRKSKLKNINSLVIFEDQKATLNFLNKMNEYIYISFPQFKISFFYFLRKEFSNLEMAKDEAELILQTEFARP